MPQGILDAAGDSPPSSGFWLEIGIGLRVDLVPSNSRMARPITSGICGTTALPSAVRRSTRKGTPSLSRQVKGEGSSRQTGAEGNS